MERLSSLAALMTVLVTVTSSTRCYMCREVTQLEGNARFYKKKADALKSMGWILPCSDESFVIYPQVGCMKRTYYTNEMCYPNKKCKVKVMERYPVLPPVATAGMPFFSKPFNEGTVRQRPCKGDLCNGDYKNEYKVGAKCYHQCGRVSLYGLTEEELANYNLPVIPCDDSTVNYCGDDMECGIILGSADYTDERLNRNITVEGWYASCVYKDNDSIDHVLNDVRLMMAEYPDIEIRPRVVTNCDTQLCNYVE